jgi:hypothetical protein
MPTNGPNSSRELPCLTHCGNAKVVALLGLGWTDFSNVVAEKIQQPGHNE